MSLSNQRFEAGVVGWGSEVRLGRLATRVWSIDEASEAGPRLVVGGREGVCAATEEEGMMGGDGRLGFGDWDGRRGCGLKRLGEDVGKMRGERR